MKQRKYQKASPSSAQKTKEKRARNVLQIPQQKFKSWVRVARLKVTACLTNIPLFCQWTTCTAQVHTRYHPSDVTTCITADTNFLKKPAANIFRGGDLRKRLVPIVPKHATWDPRKPHTSQDIVLMGTRFDVRDFRLPPLCKWDSSFF